ncbi:TPA: ead/Ea22-like family protein [Salmonella enterica subsp. enterica serovar Matopeni]|nr:ead/Ea22-like family protein [Salmonella enterica]EHJ6205811.1 ead/Ea22-like family protein [Salmonella enterica]EIV6900929.1 ead/Ea22-like family protein [Salmonella enterica]HEC7893491.1 ead/Ea22-like family protein [Salmonella enterica subsp. enterica serovar Matopeni]
MGSNIIELAKLGHERAAELKASCGAVDVRSLAQLISDLSTQLEVQHVRSTELAVQLANAESKCRELAAENAVKQEFIKTCFRAAADAGSMDGADIQDLGERLGLFGRETYQPVLHGYICGHEAGEDTVYVMKKTPATDSFLAEVQASSRNEGINYAASRLAAAYNHGFIDKPLAEVSDVVRMILDAKDELANATIPPADGLSGEYAEKSLAEFAAQIRKGAAL